MVEEKKYIDIAREILNDTFKAKIIKKYLFIMNQLINKYLQSMFFVNFHLDDLTKQSKVDLEIFLITIVSVR